ncbi:MAG: WG repeat-containing protein [Bacteroidota bacterium]
MRAIIILAITIGCLTQSLLGQSRLFEFTHDKHWGVMDKEGKVIIQPEYDFVLTNMLPDYPNYVKVVTNRKFGMFDSEKGLLLPPVYTDIRPFHIGQEFKFFQITKGVQKGLADRNGKIVYPLSAREITTLKDTLVQLKVPGGYRIWNPFTNYHFPALYDSAWVDQTQKLVVKNPDTTYSIMGLNGKVIIDKISKPLRFLNDHVALVIDYRLKLNAKDTLYQYGLLSAKLDTIFPNILQKVRVENDYIVFTQNGKEGVLTPKGRKYIPPRFQRLKVDSTGRFWYSQKELWGVMGRNRKVIMKPAFPEPGTFWRNVAVVKNLNKRFGLINQFGDWLAEPLYKSIQLHPAGVARLKQSWGTDWLQVPFEEDGSRSFRMKIILRNRSGEDEWVKKGETDVRDKRQEQALLPENWIWYRVRKRSKDGAVNNYYGLKDTLRKKIILPARYNRFKMTPYHNFCLLSRGRFGNQRFGLFNYQTGKMILPPTFIWIGVNDFKDSEWARVINNEGYYQLIDEYGKTHPKMTATFIGRLNQNRIRILDGGKTHPPHGRFPYREEFYQGRDIKNPSLIGIMRPDGEYLLPPTYPRLHSFRNGVAKVSYKIRGRSWGLIDTLGNEIVTPSYDRVTDPVANLGKSMDKDLESYFGKQFATPYLVVKTEAKKDRMFVALDTMGLISFILHAQSMGSFHEGKAWIKRNNKYQFVDKSGKICLNKPFDKAGDFGEGLAPVNENGRWYYIDHEGNPAGPKRKALHLGTFVEGLAYARTEKGIGFIDKKGRWVIRPIFIEVGSMFHGMAIAKQKKKFGVIDNKGNWIIKPKYDLLERDGDTFIGVLDMSQSSRVRFDRNEKKVSPPTNYSYKWGGNRLVKTPEGYGLVNRNNELQGNRYFTEINPFRNGVSRVKVGHFYGLINRYAEFLLEPEYIRLQLETRNRAKVFYYDQDGQGNSNLVRKRMEYPTQPGSSPLENREYFPLFDAIKQRLKLDYLRDVSDGLIIAEKHSQFGIVKYDGTPLYTDELVSVKYAGEGLFQLIKEGNIFYLHAKGDIVKPKL